MAAIGNMKIKGYKVAYWKHTYRVTLPTGEIFWGTSFLELTKKEIRKTVENLVDICVNIFQAGKDSQCAIIKEALQINDRKEENDTQRNGSRPTGQPPTSKN